MSFDITFCEPVFRVVIENQIIIPQQFLPHNETPPTQAHDISFRTIFRTVRCAILSQNQLVIKKAHSNLLGSIWLEGWKSKIIENGARMAKLEDRKYFNSFHFCLVGSEKM